MRHHKAFFQRAGRAAAPKPDRIPAGDRPMYASDEELT